MGRKRKVEERQTMYAKLTNEGIEAQFTEWIEEMGGESYIREGLARFRELHNLIDEQYLDLVEKYPDKWIAMTDGEKLIVAGSPDELFANLDEQGIDRADVATKFIRAKGRRMIL